MPGAFVDDRRFLQSLKDAIPGLEEEAWHEEEQRANRIRDAAKRYAHVDTGALRDSITVEQGQENGERVINVIAADDAAIPEEFGTRFQQAHHFMTPAIEENVT